MLFDLIFEVFWKVFEMCFLSFRKMSIILNFFGFRQSLLNSCMDVSTTICNYVIYFKFLNLIESSSCNMIHMIYQSSKYKMIRIFVFMLWNHIACRSKFMVNVLSCYRSNEKFIIFNHFVCSIDFYETFS